MHVTISRALRFILRFNKAKNLLGTILDLNSKLKSYNN
jgi:hypothetical protein